MTQLANQPDLRTDFMHYRKPFACVTILHHVQEQLHFHVIVKMIVFVNFLQR